ncbi:MAG: hypothetical protein A2Y89_07645 [Chloroflexi bacterium RBG_13_51_18]|nr:MAG: hypothetical protein A2Y89_07645 [Chloroflexi bacterium RBG_13_51_18]
MSNKHNARTAFSIISAAITTILLLNFFVFIPCPVLSATPQALRWTRVDIPAEGEAGGWVLAGGSDIQHLTMAADGTLYAYGKGLTFTLYKSTDRGLKWSCIGNIQDAIKDIAVSPYDSNIIYYATTAAIYRSTDGGKSFLPLPASPGGAGAGNIEVTSVTATWLNSNIVAVSTRDTDGGEYGGVYILNEGDIIPTWTDSAAGNYDVYTAVFSPNYAADRQIVAVATDETDTFVCNKIGNADWNAFIGRARLNKDNTSPPSAIAIAGGAAIAFPVDYYADTSSGNNYYFVAVDTGTGQGDIYKIYGVDAPGESIATDLNCGSAYGEINTDITGLTVCCDGQYSILLAGAADSCRTYISTDGGISWGKSKKEPTGVTDTGVLMAPDFTASGLIYAATSGSGSALSISRDMGQSWNQISLIDTAITSIVDFAPSTDSGTGSNIFMITFGGKHNLWRSTDDGLSWERILSGDSAAVDNLAFIGLVPQYGGDSRTLFTVGESGGKPAIWESKDNGQTFQYRFTREPGTGTAFAIDAWVITGESTIYTGSFNGSQAKIYRTTNSGLTYSEGAVAGAHSLYSLVVSPHFEKDGAILAGNTNGQVYYSSDNGSSFQPLPFDAAAPPFTGSISVAFDADFESNNAVYAASDTADSGLYRFIVGESDEWESIDGNLPAGAAISQLNACGNGVLYAVNLDGDGGMERCLNPRQASGPVFETVTLGLSGGATLSGLWQCANRIWSIDTFNCKLMTYYDTLTSPAVQISPENQTPGIGSLVDHTVRNITIDWETMDGATNYEWQCTYNTDFSTIPASLNGTTSASSVRLPALEPATTYHWRVRACAPVFSPWSAKRSFTTSMDTEGVNLLPEMPAAGAEGVSIKPVFQWSAVIGAEAYELLVATDADFTHPVILKINEYALTANAWQCDVSLDYATTYYWKIRATTASTSSAWSSASVFITESEPIIAETPPAEEPETTPTFNDTLMSLSALDGVQSFPAGTSPVQSVPVPPPVPTTIINQMPDIPGWLIYFIGGLLGIVFLSLMIVLVVVLKIKRF